METGEVPTRLALRAQGPPRREPLREGPALPHLRHPGRGRRRKRHAAHLVPPQPRLTAPPKAPPKRRGFWLNLPRSAKIVGCRHAIAVSGKLKTTKISSS